MQTPLRLFAVLFLTISITAHAQVPEGINYQSVARDATGQILSNHTVSIEFAIHDSVPAGPVIYSETQNMNTNLNGIFSTVIGTGNIIIGNFGGINWGKNGKYLQVLMDFSGGSNYQDMGTSEFMSVPYSLFSQGSANGITSAKYDTTGILNLTTAGLTTITSGKGAWTTVGNGAMSPTNFIGTTDNNDFILKGHNIEGTRFTAGGAMLATGSTSTGITPASGAGTRMMWIPAKSAFREGTVTGTGWDDANIGANSIAMGTDAFGKGANTTAIGNNVAAIGNNSSALGNGLIAKSMNMTAIGSYNDTTGSGSPTSWVSTDPLFQIGNGTSSARSNALTISKGGNISAAGLQITGGITLTPTASPLPVLTTLTTLNIGTQGYLTLSSILTPALNDVILGPGTRTGQILVVEVMNSLPGNGIRFNKGSSYNMQLSASYIDLQADDVLVLLWDGTIWEEMSHSINH
jgi:hypothetical protein